MSNDYANGKCCAIKRDGERCNGRWATALPVIFSWDPVAGVGKDGPYAVLCWRHRNMRDRRRPGRIRVVHGWLGGYNKYDYGACVFKHVSGWTASPWWAARSKLIGGGPGRTDAA